MRCNGSVLSMTTLGTKNQECIEIQMISIMTSHNTIPIDQRPPPVTSTKRPSRLTDRGDNPSLGPYLSRFIERNSRGKGQWYEQGRLPPTIPTRTRSEKYCYLGSTISHHDWRYHAFVNNDACTLAAADPCAASRSKLVRAVYNKIRGVVGSFFFFLVNNSFTWLTSDSATS